MMVLNHQNEYLFARIEEQGRAMDQFSREIRENIGQLLNFTKMNMFPIAKYATDTKQIELIENTKQLLDMLIKDVHNISHSLNSDYIKINGLLQVIQEEIDFTLSCRNIKCNLDITGNHVTFEPEKELLIYRIAHEAFQNIAKHAAATTVNISLSYAAHEFVMLIADNGTGFDTLNISEANGSGIANMMQRTMILNGSLNIDSQPSGGGCRITFKVNNCYGIS